MSPGLTPALGQRCRDLNLPLLPGVGTATEVMRAADQGFTFLKLFPAVAVGGLNLLRALAGPFPDIAFCPTGGITPDSAPEYLAAHNVPVCGGTWLTPSDAVESMDWDEITRRAAHSSTLATNQSPE